LSIDPVDRELLLNSLRAVADDMAISLARSAYSMVVREHLDFSTALFDVNGNLVVQGTCLAAQLGALPFAMRAILAKFPDGLRRGDVALTNDPYLGGCTHLPDFVTIAPLVAGAGCIGYAAVLGHKLDIGGRAPGGMATDSTEIFQEGLRIPPTLVVTSGMENAALLELIAANVRMPAELLGDLRGQLAALHVGQAGVEECVARFGLELVEQGMQDILDYAERLGREALRKLPPGRASFTDSIDDDGAGGQPIALTVAVELAGDHVVIDYTQLPDQVPTAINTTLCTSYSVALFALTAIVGADVLVNDGLARILELRSRPGSVADAVFPAAVGSRGLVLYRLWDALLGAINQLLPDRPMGAGGGGADTLTFSGIDANGNRFVVLDPIVASWGARRSHDGVTGVSHPTANFSNTPVEHLEAEYPLMVEEYSIVPDSGGIGEYRGGCALRRQYRVLADSANVDLRRMRWRFAPFGVAGARPGSLSSTQLVRASGSIEELPANGHFLLRRGDRLIHTTSGSGGFGDPAKRDPLSAARDLADGYITATDIRRLTSVGR
jgi:N-methylhydantoinase B